MSEEYLEVEEINKDFKVVVVRDDCPMNPLEDYDTLLTIASWHNRYDFDNRPREHTGYETILWYEIPRKVKNELQSIKAELIDRGVLIPATEYEHSYLDLDLNEPREFELFLQCKQAVYLPLHAYEHGNIRLSTASFSCPWDSGQLGFIYAMPEEIKRWYPSWKRITKARVEEVEKLLTSMLKAYADYVEGSVYGFQVLQHDEIIESCYGFIGSMDYAMEEGKAMAKWLIEDEEKKTAELITRALSVVTE